MINKGQTLSHEQKRLTRFSPSNNVSSYVYHNFRFKIKVRNEQIHVISFFNFLYGLINRSIAVHGPENSGKPCITRKRTMC